MKVVFFHRKPRPNFNFSIENLFTQIRRALPDEVTPEVKELTYFSNGFFKRLYIGLEAAFHQGDVNHITGDINFIAIFLRKSRTILTIHDVGFMEKSHGFSRFLLKWFWIILPIRRCSKVVCVSESTKKELLKYIQVEPSRIRVINVPISPLFVKNTKPFNKTEPRILQIGTLPNKNVNRLIKALEGIRCTLVIVGNADDELVNQLNGSGIKYELSKNLSDEDLLNEYNNSDILSFVSTYEGFGMPIVEANSIGRVVLTSNVLSMPEVAGNAAHLVDPFSVNSIRSGILKVIQDDVYRERLISNGFLNIQRFDVKKIAFQYTEIYRTLYAKKNSS